MGKRKIIIAALSLALSINLLFASASFAAPEESNVDRNSVKKKLKEYQETKRQVENLQKQIDATDKQLSKTFDELERLNDRQAQTRKQLRQILVESYTSGQHHMERQLLNSKSVPEFLFRLELLRLTIQRKLKVFQKYQKQKKIITQKKKKLQEELAKLQPLLKQSEQKSKQLEKQYRTLAKELQKNQSGSNPALDQPPGDLSWLNKARAMIGTVRYVFGASSYPYFDCSSWTQYVFRKYRGIELPRTAAAQSKVGTFVSKANLQPGDLVFFQGTYKAGVSHVGIYLGNGNFISNKNSRLHLRIESINSSYSKKHYWGAKRVN